MPDGRAAWGDLCFAGGGGCRAVFPGAYDGYADLCFAGTILW